MKFVRKLEFLANHNDVKFTQSEDGTIELREIFTVQVFPAEGSFRMPGNPDKYRYPSAESLIKLARGERESRFSKVAG